MVELTNKTILQFAASLQVYFTEKRKVRAGKHTTVELHTI